MIHLGRREQTSLLDAANHFSVDYYVVFREAQQPWLRRWLKPGFSHVECWGYVPPGAWIRFDTAAEFISVEVYSDPPWALLTAAEKPTYLHYSALIPHGTIRQPFFMGPITCVVLTAAFLGLRLPWWCRTPYQMYRLLKRKMDEPQSAKAAA